MSYLERYERNIAAAFGIEFGDTVKVLIADSRQQFESAMGPGFPDWGVAAAIKEYNLIVVNSSPEYGQVKSLNELLGHELCHLMINRATGGRWLPRWMEEGLCQMFSGEWRISHDFLLTRAVWGSGLLPLVSLENVNRFGGAKAALAYAQSYQAVSAMSRDFGIDFFGEFFRVYRDKGDFYGAFFEQTGYRYLEWVTLWQSKTSQRYRFVLFIFDSQLLFVVLPILFVLIYLIKRFQSRRKLKEWERLEKLRGDSQEY